MKTSVISALGVLALACAGTSGCSSTKGLRPSQPSNGAKISDLQPTFAWKASKHPGVTYDLTVYPKSDSGEAPSVKSAGAYYREGLSGTEHKVETPLQGDTLYAWAVRERNGAATGEWNRRTSHLILLVYNRTITKPYEFRTP